MSKQQHRKQIFRGGLVMLVLGAMLGITGFVSSPAGASDKVAICHRTSSVTNPYRLIMVDLSATGGPDHTTHTGPVFDPLVNTQQNKGEWGDIIPNGLNWEAGAALYAASCQLPGEPPDVAVCAFDDDLDATDPLCLPVVVVPPMVCPEGQVGTWPVCLPVVVVPPMVCPPGEVGTFPVCTTPEPKSEVCPEGQVGTFPVCTTPEPKSEVCPEGQVGTFPDCEEAPLEVRSTITSQDDPPQAPAPVVDHARLPTQVEGLLLTAAAPTAATPAAANSVVAAALPRTGTTTIPLAQLGLGLLLLGAGAVIVGREQVITA